MCFHSHLQGTCAYEITHTCGNMSDDALTFRVVAANSHRGNLIVSFVSTVDVWLSRGGVQSHITIGQNRRVKVPLTEVHMKGLLNEDVLVVQYIMQTLLSHLTVAVSRFVFRLMVKTTMQTAFRLAPWRS